MKNTIDSLCKYYFGAMMIGAGIIIGGFIVKCGLDIIDTW